MRVEQRVAFVQYKKELKSNSEKHFAELQWSRMTSTNAIVKKNNWKLPDDKQKEITAAVKKILEG